jgi:U4/U6 small nuclear ribonucleoprotein PRP4
MRSLNALYTIPAHLSNVSDVRFFRSIDGIMPSNAQATSSSSADINMDESGDKADTSTLDEEEWRYRSGLYLASAGYDGLVKLWSADDWQLLRTLPTDGGKVMSLDLSSDTKLLASGTYNRNFQIFAPEELPI